MDGHGETSGAEALFAQAGWVKALARRLVRDDATAQDVVQETWLAALRAAPLEGGRLRPWLARVLANAARKSKRGDARRAERESIAARAERLPATDEIAARIELQRRLADALATLDEPYRRTIVLRFLDGLEPAEIASREGVPAGTVRWRVSEGLARLRDKLDARADGGRAQWALLCLPFTRPPSIAKLAILAAASSPGVLIMNATVRTAFVATALAAGVAGVWWWTQSGHRDDASSRVEARSTELERGIPTPPADLEPAPSDATREGTRLSAAELAARATLATTIEPVTALEGRFVDEAHRPIAGVHAELEKARIDVDSAADGRFRLVVGPKHANDELTARRDGLATLFRHVELAIGTTTELGDVVLRPGATLFGRVVAGDGRPFQGARVLVVRADVVQDAQDFRRRGPFDSERVPSTTSAADGSFEIAGAPVAPESIVRVLAAAKEHLWTFTEPMELVALEREGPIDLVLDAIEAKDRIAGVVLDPDGRPVPCRVQVHYEVEGSSWGSSIAAGSDGRFDLHLDKIVAHDFFVHDMDGRWPDVGASGVAPGTLDLVLRFESPRWCDLAVIDGEGRPVTEFAITLERVGITQSFERRPLAADAPGAKRFAVPTARFTVSVDAPGFAIAKLGPFAPEEVGATLACTLKSLPGLRGRVLASGKPVAGAKVEARRLVEKDERVEWSGYASRVEPSSAAQCVTDAEGRFVLAPRERASYAIFAQAPDVTGVPEWAVAELDVADVDPAVGVDGLEVTLVRGGTIEGRVLTSDPAGAAGAIVAFDRHDARARTIRADKDGAFRLEHLTPGDWWVGRVQQEVRTDTSSWSSSSGGGASVQYDVNCTVADGETLHFDVDERREPVAVLDALVAVDDAPAAAWRITAYPASKTMITSDTPAISTDGRGRARLVVGRPDRYRVQIVPPAELGGGCYFSMEVELASGDNAWSLPLDRASIHGRWVHAPEGAVVRIDWRGEGGVSGQWQPELRGIGDFRVPFVAAGELEVAAYDAKSGWREIARKTVVARRGEDVAVELP